MEPSEPSIRRAKREDLEELAELTVRLKRLNEEFDPLLKVREDALERAKAYVESALGSSDSLILAGISDGKIVALLKADFRERKFYKPSHVGEIVEFYVLPEFRRKGFGERLLQEGIERLVERGAGIVTAEFPAQNMIAVDFYRKQEFRGIVNIFAREVAPDSP